MIFVDLHGQHSFLRIVEVLDEGGLAARISYGGKNVDYVLAQMLVWVGIVLWRFVLAIGLDDAGVVLGPHVDLELGVLVEVDPDFVDELLPCRRAVQLLNDADALPLFSLHQFVYYMRSMQVSPSYLYA